MNPIENFITLVQEAYENHDQLQFSQLISIDETNPVVSGLVQSLAQVQEIKKSKVKS